MLANITTGAYAGGSVSVTTVGNAWTYQVTFGGKLQAIEVPTMTFTGAGGISSTASVVTTVEGGQGLNEILPMLCLGKFGDGNLILGGPDAYTGNTYLWDGDLTIRNSTSLGLGSANVYIMGGDNTKIMGSVVASPQYAQLLVDGSLGPVNVTNRGLIFETSVTGYGNQDPTTFSAGNPADYSGMIYNIAGNNSWTNYEAAEQQVIDLHTSSTMTGTIAITVNDNSSTSVATLPVTGSSAAQIAAQIQSDFNNAGMIHCEYSMSIGVDPNANGDYMFDITWYPNVGNNEIPGRNQAHPLVQLDTSNLALPSGAYATVTRTVTGMEGFYYRKSGNNQEMMYVGAAPGTSLALNGEWHASDNDDGGTGQGVWLAKTGGGTITLGGDGGSIVNAYNGGGSWNLVVLDGTVVLAKQSDSGFVNGTIYIGDATQGDSANTRTAGGTAVPMGQTDNPLGSTAKTTPDAVVQAFPESVRGQSVVIDSTGQYQMSPPWPARTKCRRSPLPRRSSRPSPAAHGRSG